MNLYKVVLKGFNDYELGIVNQSSYVLAEDFTSASNKVTELLESENYGFSGDRKVLQVNLIAEDKAYSNTYHRLFL